MLDGGEEVVGGWKSVAWKMQWEFHYQDLDEVCHYLSESKERKRI